MEQSELRQNVREFGQESIEPIAQEFDRTGKFPYELLSAAAKEGYVGHMIPETYGGPGYNMIESTIVTEETWRADTNLGWALGLTGFSTNVYVVNEYAGEELRSEWLSGVASGNIIDGIALTEPNHGSDVADIETTAEHDGDEWVINGEKKFIGNSTIGDRLLVFAKTDPNAGHRGISAFIIPTERAIRSRRLTTASVGTQRHWAKSFLIISKFPLTILLARRTTVSITSWSRLSMCALPSPHRRSAPPARHLTRRRNMSKSEISLASLLATSKLSAIQSRTCRRPSALLEAFFIGLRLQ